MNRADLSDLRTIELKHDLPFIIELAKNHGPAILELGCGTGRVLQALVAAGFRSAGIDKSAEVLALARNRCPMLRLEEKSMESFEMGALYDLILVPFNTFECLLTFQDKLSMLRRVLNHSHSETILYIDTWPVDFSAESLAPEQPLRALKTIVGKGGEQIEVLFTARRHLAERRSDCTMVYRWHTADNRLHQVEDHYSVSPLTADEVWLLLQTAGFRIEGWYGDYKRTAYDPARSTQLIALARPMFGHTAPPH